MTDAPRPSASADDSGHGGVQILVTAGPSRLAADLAVQAGGLGLGPDPHDLVAAGLAACTARPCGSTPAQAWTLGAMRVEVTWRREAGATPADVFDRGHTLSGDLDADQRARLMAVANACPVHKLLTAGAGGDDGEVGAILPLMREDLIRNP
ncbi:osmotically inducible protein OsmC [Caulobacter sp. B11]|nr:OsmC family protein [Caulobacter sp. B11]PHY13196.1 osmotically inducible protein OsmC [Caulobacter sp. B11]